MKLDLRENMYVRNCYGRIAKIEYIEDNTAYCDNWLYQSYEDHITFINLDDEDDIDEILKTSYNIIDILEEGDYVNGVEIIKIYEEGDSFRGNRNYIFKEKTIEVANDNYETIPVEALFINKQIETIVTHEQMEQMAYKVEE